MRRSEVEERGRRGGGERVPLQLSSSYQHQPLLDIQPQRTAVLFAVHRIYYYTSTAATWSSRKV